MIHETKPRLAKFAFEIGMSRDILEVAHILAKFHEILHGVKEEEKGAYWKVMRNGMGTITMTIYINDEVVYNRLKTALHSTS